MMVAAEADAAAGTTATTTKRARRKKTNEKHAWPQHPKIQGEAQRAKAYVRAAGLSSSNTTKVTVDTTPTICTLTKPQESFGRLLGGPDVRVRHRTVLQLKAYLKAVTDPTSGAGITETELLKLCYSLWYTLFLADRVPVQEELCNHVADLIWCVGGTEEEDEYAAREYLEATQSQDIEELHVHDELGNHDHDGDDQDVTMEEIENTLGSGSDDAENEEEEEEEETSSSSSSDDVLEKQAVLLNDDIDECDVPHCRGAHCSALFFRIFFRTVLREWSKLDKYRIDKFYTCIRRMVQVGYQYMAKRNWNAGIIRLFNDALYEEVLCKSPNGVRYHIIDVCLEELAKANAATARMPLTEATFLDVLEPFFAMAQTGFGDDSVHTRVLDNVLDKFLTVYSLYADDQVHDDSESDADAATAVQPRFTEVHVGTLSQFIFEIASEESIKASYRKKLYDMHKKYERRMTQIGPERDVQMDEDEGDDERIYGVDQDSDDDGEDANVEVSGSEEEDEQEEDVPPPKAQKAKKSSSTGKQEVKPEEKPRTNSQRKKDKKKRQSKEPVDDQPDEEEITISVFDQKAAKISLKSIEKKAREESEDERTIEADSKKKRKLENEEAARRVKFGNTNKARSWKASMKALQTMETPTKKELTPEKSILLNKGAKVVKKKAAGKGKKNRKKATDYF